MPGEYYRSLRRSGLWRSCEGTEPLLSAIKKEGKLIEQEKSRDDSGGSSSPAAVMAGGVAFFFNYSVVRMKKKKKKKNKVPELKAGQGLNFDCFRDKIDEGIAWFKAQQPEKITLTSYDG